MCTWFSCDDMCPPGVRGARCPRISACGFDAEPVCPQALEMSEQFTPEDLRRVAMALAHQNNRSVPLLRAISYYLIQKQAPIGPNVLLDLVFAYGELPWQVLPEASVVS